MTTNNDIPVNDRTAACTLCGFRNGPLTALQQGWICPQCAAEVARSSETGSRDGYSGAFPSSGSSSMPRGTITAPNSEPARPRRFLRRQRIALFFSLIPGLGQMYLGQMRRGLQLLLLFWGNLALERWNFIFDSELLIPVLVGYSFFETYHTERKLQSGQAVADENLGIFDWWSGNWRQHRTFLGIALLIGAVLTLVNAPLPSLGILRYFDDYRYLLRTVIMSALLAIGGLALLIKRTAKEDSDSLQ
ncbi:hypothetical protein GJ688_13375 [Heliobacillus mobilis]|uniref:Uncharacterized protein n=1 Tax=Heliobacterium mobile TaxID=28064 RepID=A0A6I3SMK4_HELMO|nr:hypothetical protein [Heliobacterium mobile]MTV49965.1 hypothetical protein [Heliobacterium mobile]